MKTKLSFLKKHAIRFLKDESGQGTMEYILILVGVVTLGFAFKGQIVDIVKNKMGTLGTDIQGFQVDK